MSKPIFIQIAAIAREGETQHVLQVTTSQAVPTGLIEKNPESLDNILGALLTTFAFDLPATLKGTSLPENASGNAKFLDLARQWLACVESGKHKAVCTAVEHEDGKRHIHIVIDPSRK